MPLFNHLFTERLLSSQFLFTEEAIGAPADPSQFIFTGEAIGAPPHISQFPFTGEAIGAPPHISQSIYTGEIYVCIGALLPSFIIEYWGLGLGRRSMCALAHFSSLCLPLSTGGWLGEEIYVRIGALLLPLFTIEYWGLGLGRRSITGGLAWGGFSVHIGAPLLQPSLRLGGLSVHIGAPPPIILVLYFLRKDDTCSTIRYVSFGLLRYSKIMLYILDCRREGPSAAALY
ncbi:uncharacterized protein F5147DRAFT_659705 [Suillus discolor]|uniref:Uncharacterized protein n=1 Tax=Suillus discolor TaxID=1912936 RepID=A0A9P7ES79_9AGAM|nr:uncharacterized protein F5147DRAFT_659705 [Suillus discolor]KAG2084850.1 hypothetical protein F5147DRAFT_659705 [Suillus discolor]